MKVAPSGRVGLFQDQFGDGLHSIGGGIGRGVNSGIERDSPQVYSESQVPDRLQDRGIALILIEIV